jgi:hypothetical protein
MATTTIPEIKNYTIRQQGIYRMPDGLRMNLPLYILRRFFRPTNPITLFEHMVKTYGNASSYRVFNTPIIFLNEPEWVQEILVTKAPQLT